MNLKQQLAEQWQKRKKDRDYNRIGEILETINQHKLNLKMDNKFKCSVCGKFIGASEFDRDDIHIEYIPDSEYTEEKIIFTHKNCMTHADRTFGEEE